MVVVFGVGCESMLLYFRIVSLLVATSALSLPVGSFSSTGQERLIATAEVISQKYCSLDDALFSVDITLHLRFENRTDKVLILDKQFGKFPSRRIIAKSRESLALRDYEDDPLFDSFGYEDPPHFTPSMGLLRSNFILLPAGQSFESSAAVDVFVWYVPDRKGRVTYGDHVLQMGFLGWSYEAKASQFEEAWRKFGQLVTEEIYTEPVLFQIPRNSQIDKACN
jgi:hypothetical protein